MDEYPVKVGSMLFTMVDPHVGHEVAYNRWYERDHFYGGCMIGPGILAGGRWVATRALKDLRTPATSPFASPVDAGSYLALYFIHDGHVKEHFDWAGKQVGWLYQNGRGFTERSHAHTCLYDFAGAVYAPGETVSIELALDHRFPTLGVVVTEPRGGADDQTHVDAVRAAFSGVLNDGTTRILSSWRLRGGGVQGNANAPMSLGTDGGQPDRLVHLIFGDRPAVDAVRRYHAAAEALDTDVAEATFVSSFLPTNIGTDDYTDQLW